MYATHNRSIYYDNSLAVYDIVFSTKIYNLSELKTLGAQSTELFLDSFDEDLQVKMLRSASNFEELFHSLEYNYLTNLPVAVPTL